MVMAWSGSSLPSSGTGSLFVDGKVVVRVPLEWGASGEARCS